MITIALPWPPSINHYYRPAGRGRLIIGEDGKRYRIAVRARILSMRAMANAERRPWALPVSGPIHVEIIAHFPNSRRRDLDNLLKSSLDAMTHAGVWADDSQIVDLRVVKSLNGAVNDGHLTVRIRSQASP